MRPSRAVGRIAIVNDIAGVALLEAKGLRAAGWHVDFYDLPKPGAGWPFWAKFLALPFRLLMYMPLVIRLRRGGYDIVHVHFLSQGVVGAASGKPYVLHAHGSDLHLNFANPVLRSWTRRWMKRARQIFYVTPNLRPFLSDFESKAMLLPNPVDTHRFAAIAAPQGIERALIFMRLQAIKGAEAVFASAAAIAHVVSLTAIRSGPLASDYSRRYSDSVAFIDPVPHSEVPDLLSRFDAVIGQMEQGVPGLSELEALAAGRVVVMRLDEALFPDDPPPVFGVSAADEIAPGLQRLKGDPVEVARLSAAGREWVERNHGLGRHVAQLSERYRAALRQAVR